MDDMRGRVLIVDDDLALADPLDHHLVDLQPAQEVLERAEVEPLQVGRRLVREHPFAPDGEPSPVDARRFLARHGERLALDLLAHRAADLAGKTVPASEWEWLGRFRELVEQERSQPHQLVDLDVDGGDLIAAGFSEGPQLGRVLQALLAEVVEDPERNRREQLLSRARELA